MTTTAAVEPDQLRPLLQMKVGQLPDEDLLLLHRFLLRVEKERLWAELKAECAQDRAEGKFDRLNEIIAEVRAEQSRA